MGAKSADHGGMRVRQHLCDRFEPDQELIRRVMHLAQSDRQTVDGIAIDPMFDARAASPDSAIIIPRHSIRASNVNGNAGSLRIAC